MGMCAKCQEKNIPPETCMIDCEICYENKESEIPGARICKGCAEPADLCEVCIDSIQDY